MSTSEESSVAAKALRRVHRDDEDKHLAQEHFLKQVMAYIPVHREVNQRSPEAERQKRCRERRKAAGLMSVPVPSAIAKAIREQGGFDQWLAMAMPEASSTITAEKPVEARQTLTVEQRRVIGIGRRVDALTGWRRWIVSKVLK